METSFKHYMSALAAAMRQELPDVSDTRAEFMVDDVPYVFTAEEDSPSVFVYAVIGALPPDEEARARVFAGLLHAQYCFSESSGFSFGVDEDDTFVLLQALVDTDRLDESAFVALMDKFVKTANVWTKRLGEPGDAPGGAEDGDLSSNDDLPPNGDLSSIRV